MQARSRSRLMLVCLASMAMALLAGCSASGNGESASKAAGNASPTSSHAQTLHERTIKLAYVDWASCIAATDVVRVVLEKAGFRVETVSLTGAMMYAGLAGGDVDASVCAWLPNVHKQYYAKTHRRLVNLGPNLRGTRIGLVVPAYVKINSIPELAANADKFHGRILGIDPGAGEMAITQQAINTYALPLTLTVGSSDAMISALGDAIQRHQPIVVTGWTPHWMWSRWKLKYLEDPKGVFGQPGVIDTLVRQGFQQQMPRATAILDAFHWTTADMGEVMASDGKPAADPAADARSWVKAHPRQVAAWLGK